MKMQKFIWVTFQKEGIHKYPQALEDPRLATGGVDDVSFLGYPHRHMFHFKVQLEVFHADREVEFIQFKRELESLFDSGVMVANHKSCEMMADDLWEYINNHYPGRDCMITVSEDGENGSTLEIRR